MEFYEHFRYFMNSLMDTIYERDMYFAVGMFILNEQFYCKL